MEKSAVYAIGRDASGERASFRVGQPTDWLTAQDRWLRLDDRRRANRAPRVRHARRYYIVETFEVRTTDRHGRGLGSHRHATALPVPYRACKVSA